MFAVSAPIIKYNNLNLEVELPANLWYTNQNSQVLRMDIDFGDGSGFQSVNLGQIKNISYSQPDIYDWIYKLTLINNQVLYSQSKLIITQSTATSSWNGHKQY